MSRSLPAVAVAALAAACGVSREIVQIDVAVSPEGVLALQSDFSTALNCAADQLSWSVQENTVDDPAVA